MASIKKNSGVTAITKRDIGHPQGLSFGFPPPGLTGPDKKMLKRGF